MISFFRKIMQSWVVLGLLGVLLVAFIITGVGNPFGSGGSPDAVAKVGSEKIASGTLASEFQRILRLNQRERPGVTAEEAVASGLLRELMTFLVQQEAIRQFLLGQDIQVSQTQVNAEIRSMPPFQIGGVFDKARYEEVLKENGKTSLQFRQEMIENLARRQLLDAVGAGAPVPEQMASAFARLLQVEKRTSIIPVPTGFLPPPGEPKPADIDAFYKEHKKAYTTPELRDFRYLLLSPATMRDAVEVTDKDIADYYRDHPDEFGATSKRRILQVVTADEATARTIADRAKKGEDFAKVATSLVEGYTAADLELGTLSETELEKDSSADVAKAAFALAKGQVSQPLQSAFGWHVLKVADIIAGNPQPIASVRDTIIGKVKADKASDLLFERSKKVEDALSAGQDLDAVAAIAGVKPVVVKGVTRKGVLPDQNRMLEQPLLGMLVTVFDRAQGDELALEELDRESFYVAEVAGIAKARLKPLAEIRAQVATDWRRVTAIKELKALADRVAAEMEKPGAQPILIAQRYRLPPPQGMALTWQQVMEARAQNRPVPPFIARVLTLKTGKTVVAPIGDGRGFLVARLDSQSEPAIESGSPVMEAMRNQMSKEMPEEIRDQFIRAVVKTVGSVEYPKSIQGVSSQLTAAR